MAIVRRVSAVVMMGTLLALLAAACGGGSSGDQGAGRGERITDPAKVPSSTPISNTLTYQIRGDVILAPGGGAGSAAPGTTPVSSSKKYTVKSGDTCSAIAAQFGVSLADLLKANRLIDQGCTNLHEGDVLTIPGAAGTTSGTTGGTSAGPTVKPSGKEYKVQSGDTCDAIARSYGVDLAKLIALNGLDQGCQNLQVGQTIRIP